MSRLLDFTTDDAYRSKITKFAALLQHPGDRRAVIRELGHCVEAFNSVPIAIFTFLSHSLDCYSAIIYAVSQGGDTDTIALMTGAISGAYLGIEEISSEWQGKLENRYYILNLADRLW